MNSDRFEIKIGPLTDEYSFGDGINKNKCRYDGKKYDVSEVFMMIRSRGKNNGSMRFAGEIYIGNIREFIRDLDNFEKTSSAKSSGTFSIEGHGADEYSHFSEGEELIDCPICEEYILPEDAFLSLPGFYDSPMVEELVKDKNDMELIHKECVPRFVDILKDSLEKTDFVDEAI